MLRKTLPIVNNGGALNQHGNARAVIVKKDIASTSKNTPTTNNGSHN